MITGRFTDAQIDDIKARNPVADIARRYVSLRPQSGKLVGPCPVCSRDRASRKAGRFEIKGDGWVCAVCSDGGDVIRLVEKVEGLDFKGAVEWLGGTQRVDPEKAAARDRERAEKDARREANAETYRQRERGNLYDVWIHAAPPWGTSVEGYLRLRGLEVPDWAKSAARLRYVADMPYYHGDEIDGTGRKKPRMIHRGPAMVAPIVRGGKFSGLHFTWIDLTQPNGKARILDPDTDEALPAKKVRGSKSAGAIELLKVAPGTAAVQLVLAEGVETVLSAWLAMKSAGADLTLTEFWSAVDLGNLGGPAAAQVVHPTLITETGRPRRVPGPDPDMDKPGIVLPDSVIDVVLLGDGDSDPVLTQCAIHRAAVRFRAGNDARVVRVAWAPAGKDFNDAIGDRAALIKDAKPVERPVIPAPGKAKKTAETLSSKDGCEPPNRPPADEQELNRRLASFPLTDLGNAARFVERFGQRFKWCHVIGWLVWDGKRWSPDLADGLVAKAVHETVRLIRAEAKAIAGTPDDYAVKTRRDTVMRSEQIAAWCLTSQGARHFGCIAKTAASYLEIAATALDADPMKINVENGTLTITGGDDDYVHLKPHDPGDLITKIVPVPYDPAAVCPQYDKFIETVQPEASARRFLHQWGGLSLTGDMSEQKLVVFWGRGKNGKSTLLETWDAVAGDYGKSCPIETFLDPNRARRGGEPTPDLAMLAGVRFLRTSEPERGAKLAEALIKLVTGGDAMQVRHLNRDFFELRPQFKLTISGNYRPQIRGADEGIWRRVVLLPWSVTVEKSQQDPQLLKKLATEKPGVLNRLLDGLRDWADNGLTLPDAAVSATAAYRSDSDPLGRFLVACVAESPGKRTQSSALYFVYVAWAKANGEHEWSANGFSQAMTERGYQKKHSDVIWWLNIELKLQASDFPVQPS